MRMMETPSDTASVRKPDASGVKENSAGIMRPTTAITSEAECRPAEAWLNLCSTRPQPPTRKASPSTTRTFPMIEPVIDALTTSSSPSRIKKIAMIISVTLPKVAFKSPPIWGPDRAARSSVA
jgi:hypothetical protein